jgi:cyclopropane fatty-acyl-phospholipid synthase-like methyltransferase
VTPADPDQLRAASRETWETAAAGWGREAEAVRTWGMPVSLAMVESLDLQPGQRVLELAAGPGDTGDRVARSSPPTAPSR